MTQYLRNRRTASRNPDLHGVQLALGVFPGAHVVPSEGWPPPGAVEARALLATTEQLAACVTDGGRKER